MQPNAIASLLLFTTLTFAQSPDSLQFEAASVRVTTPHNCGGPIGARRGGPGTDSPQLMSWCSTRLRPVIEQAYDVRTIQVVEPSWVTQSDDAYYDISVSLPAGATKDDARIMLRNLLTTRFGLKVHRESKELDGYALVEGKGGSKVAKFRPKNASLAPMSLGIPLPNGVDFRAMNSTMSDLASAIQTMEFQNQQPIVDKTGIAGGYDIAFKYTPSSTTTATELPTLRTALEETLGLTLQKMKVPIEMLIVDHLERTPTEN